MTINNEAGDTAGGANTDGFDIGDNTNVVITGANVYNQDDCVAVNSGTVCHRKGQIYLIKVLILPARTSRSRMEFAVEVMGCPLEVLEEEAIIL
jgi:hypothetical protein